MLPAAALALLVAGCAEEAADPLGGYPVLRPPELAVQVIVQPPLDTLRALGTTTQFAAVTVGAAAQLVNVTVTWGSSNPAVARVESTTGVATAVGEGVTAISASTRDASGRATLVVRLERPPNAPGAS